MGNFLIFVTDRSCDNSKVFGLFKINAFKFLLKRIIFTSSANDTSLDKTVLANQFGNDNLKKKLLKSELHNIFLARPGVFVWD